jgi:hypothetical protein
MKKTRQSPTKDFKPEPLPTTQEVEKTIQAIQETPGNRAGSVGRPIKNDAIGRMKLTTTLKAEYTEKLRIYAAMNRISFADVLDMAVKKFIRDNGL